MEVAVVLKKESGSFFSCMKGVTVLTDFQRLFLSDVTYIGYLVQEENSDIPCSLSALYL